MPNRIRTETNDLIVLDDNRLLKLFLGAIGVTVTAWMGFTFLFGGRISEELWLNLFFIAWIVIFIFFFGLYSLVSETVTINKKSQSIVLQKRFPIKRFESIRKIPFSALKEIKVVISNSEDGATWSILLIQTYDDKPTRIYDTGRESDADLLAEKLSKITNREITPK